MPAAVCASHQTAGLPLPHTTGHVAFTMLCAGRGVHIITVNGYLAQRDAEW